MPHAHTPRTALRKGGISVMLTTVIVGALLITVGASVPENMTDARLHSAARRILVQPGHHAAELLPVVQQDDIHADHQALADRALRSLPSGCRENLKNFYVLYDKKNGNRGLGGADTIIVTGNAEPLEFMALVIHECGHVIDLGDIVGTPRSGESAFRDGSTIIWKDDQSVAFYEISWTSEKARKAGSRERDFVSGYAMTDAFEDFAETFAYFALQEKEFKRLAAKNPVLQAKYTFMRDVVFGAVRLDVTGKHARGTRIPWDVTRLPYSWHAKK